VPIGIPFFIPAFYSPPKLHNSALSTLPRKSTLVLKKSISQ